MLGFWLLVILAILLIALIPTWPYSRGWGYYPAGFLAVLLLLWLLLIWFGYVALWYPGRPVVVETPAVIEGTPPAVQQ